MKARWLRGMIRGPATASPPPLFVIKIGGSLLRRPDWPDAIATLLADQPSPLIVVGGGPVVDGLRSIDAASQRPASLMHQLAIDAMTLTARIVADSLGLPLVGDSAAPLGVLEAAAWLETAAEKLPVGWHVTSDSIAAVVAARTGRSLLLAKSVPPPHPEGDLGRLANSGWIDAWFPRAASGLTEIRWAAPG
jgi:aspartokinase-like uncharacterized kinase